MLKRCIQSTSKYQEKDIRLGCWLPSLGHGSILPQTSVPEFGQLDIDFFNKQLLFIFWTLDSTYPRNTPLRNAYHRRLFFVWGCNVSEEGLLGLAWNTGEWKCLAIIRPNRFLQLERAYSGTNSECPHCCHGFLSENLRSMMESENDTKIAPHHEKSLGALETTPSARVVPWSWQVVKYIVNTCICEGILCWTYQLILRALSDLNIWSLKLLLTRCFRMLQTPGTANVLGFLKSLRRTFLQKNLSLIDILSDWTLNKIGSDPLEHESNCKSLPTT